MRERRIRPLRQAGRWLAALAAVLVAGCGANGPSPSAPGQAGLTPIAFESIAGAPRPVFDALVAELTREADARQMLVVSRTEQAVFRVRGYLSAHAEGGDGKVAWVFDIFDRDARRTARLSGEERTGGGDPWAGSGVVAQIAAKSMTGVAQWLAAVAPPAAADEPALASIGAGAGVGASMPTLSAFAAD